jgi:hypothetical protein
MNNQTPWATIGVWALTLIFALVGGAVVIWGDPGALSFETYVKIMGAFVIGHGLLGIGRGIHSGLINQARIEAAPPATAAHTHRHGVSK